MNVSTILQAISVIGTFMASQFAVPASADPSDPVTNVAFGDDATLPTRFIIDDDYPVRALRDELEGLVDLLVLVGPNGRAVHAVAIRSDHAILADAAMTSAKRRARFEVTDSLKGRYFWQQLPTIQFRISGCPVPHKPSAVIASAIQVTGRCIDPPEFEPRIH